MGGFRTSDAGGPYNLTLLSQQANEVAQGGAARQNFTDADIVDFLVKQVPNPASLFLVQLHFVGMSLISEIVGSKCYVLFCPGRLSLLRLGFVSHIALYSQLTRTFYIAVLSAWKGNLTHLERLVGVLLETLPREVLLLWERAKPT